MLLAFLDQNFIGLIRLGLKLVTCSGILVKELLVEARGFLKFRVQDACQLLNV